MCATNVAVSMGSSFLRDVMERWLVVGCWLFGTPYLFNFQLSDSPRIYFVS